MEDWQMLIDMHEKLSRVLFESVDFFQEVAYTANDQRTAKRAAELFTKLEPLAKYIFVKDSPFGIEQH